MTPRRSCFLLGWLALAATLLGSGSYTSHVAATRITLPAAPKIDVWYSDGDVEFEERQISGVVRTSFHDSRGWNWFGSQDGLLRYDGDSLLYVDIRNRYDKSITVKHMLEADDGTMWIGHSGGVTKFDGEFYTTYTENDGLVSDDVWYVHLDRSGMLWIATSVGVSRFDGEEFSEFLLPPTKRNPKRGVSGPKTIRWIEEDDDGLLWFAAEGAVYTYDGAEIETIGVMNEESVTAAHCILIDREGIVWFATDEKGLIRFDGESFANVTGPMGIGSLLEASDGRLWFPAQDRGVCTLVDGELECVGPENFYERFATFSVSEDGDGNLWFVGFGAAYRYDGREVVNVTRLGPW